MEHSVVLLNHRSFFSESLQSGQFSLAETTARVCVHRRSHSMNGVRRVEIIILQLQTVVVKTLAKLSVKVFRSEESQKSLQPAAIV